MHGVQPETVHVVLPQPHQRVVDDVATDLVGVLPVQVERLAPGVRRAVGDVGTELRQVVAARAEVVVDDVLDDPQTTLVARVDEHLVRGRSAVLLLDRAPQHAVVAPAVAAAEPVDRHQLDQGDAQLHQVVQSIDGREQRALGGERADVQLVDDAARQLATGPQLVGPAVGGRVEGARQPVHPVRSASSPRVGQHRVAAVDQVAVVQWSVRRRFGQATDRAPEASAVGLHRHGAAVTTGRVDEHELDLLGPRSPDGERVVLHRSFFVTGRTPPEQVRRRG